ncbi:MAG TPA: DUF6526 family protein [Terriglobales bacterium]|nr:DUF6526 family protein [Terriglobales bacterium]
MPESPQSYSHHTRRDPIFHFFILPMFFIALVFSIGHLIAGHHHHPLHSVLLILFALAAVLLVFRVRQYPLKVQDRVIRLEERLRLALLLPESLRSRIPELTEPQLIALRFASDGEVAGLAQRAMNEHLSPEDIKKAIQHWRPDNLRV